MTLENLGIAVCNHIVRIHNSSYAYTKFNKKICFFISLQRPTRSASSISVRHECLQILIAMGRHFHWIKDHLDVIASALESSIKDEEPTIQMRAARCLDIIANAINLYLLAQSNNRDIEFDDLIKNCLKFWMRMLPCIVEEFQRENQTAALKTTLCDACSNIGVHIFERLDVSF